MKPTLAQIAKRHGIALTTVRRYRADGIDIYDDDAMQTAKEAKAKSAVAGQGTDSDSPEMAVEKALKLRADRQLAELKLARERGENIPKTEMEQELIRICRAFQAGIFALSGELPPIIAGMDAPSMEPHIKKACRRLFEEFCNGAAKIVDGDGNWTPGQLMPDAPKKTKRNQTTK